MLGRCRETPDTLRAMLTFILGGARSGKSQLAQHLARGSGREVLVLAVENDVARESVKTARSRMAEIDDPPPALVE